jgi:hypothetical protein
LHASGCQVDSLTHLRRAQRCKIIHCRCAPDQDHRRNGVTGATSVARQRETDCATLGLPPPAHPHRFVRTIERNGVAKPSNGYGQTVGQSGRQIIKTDHFPFTMLDCKAIYVAVDCKVEIDNLTPDDRKITLLAFDPNGHNLSNINYMTAIDERGAYHVSSRIVVGHESQC